MKFIRQYKLFIVRALIFAGFFFLIGFYKKYHIPKIKQWLLVEVENQSHKHLPLRLWPKSVDLEAFPPGLTFRNIKVLPQKELEKIIAPTEISSVSVRLGVWALFKGELRIGNIEIKGATLNVQLAEIASPSHTRLSLKGLDELPLDRITARNININSIKLPRSYQAQTPNLNFTIRRAYNTLRFDIEAHGLKIYNSIQDLLFDASVSSHFMLDKDGLYFSDLKMNRATSYLSGTGVITGDILNKKINKIKSKIHGDINLEEARRVALEFFDPKKIPKVTGGIGFDANIEYNLNSPIQVSYALKTKDFTIDKYNINSLELKGYVNEKNLHLTTGSIQNYFGSIRIEDGTLELGNNFLFDAKVSADKLKLSSFLNALGLPNIPVHTDITGELPCRGQIINKFSVTCQGELTARDFSVLTRAQNPFTIVAIKNISANGMVTVNEKSVSYKANLAAGDKSKGESSGVISYADGFKISYSTPNLYFSDVLNLASLKPEGKVELSGTTSGNSRFATLALNAKGEDFWLHDYYLGRIVSAVKYKAGTLYLNKTESQIYSSRFKADIEIDLMKKQIEIDGTSPFIDAEDLLLVFKRQVTLPFKITGTGSATLNASGPLEFKKLSYNLNSSLYRGTIADETFDQMQFNVVSKDGYVATKQATLSKSRSTISANGKVDPDGNLNLVLQGRNFQIEQSENLAKLKTNLSGNLNFEVTLTDYILKPNINLIGSITHVMLGEQPSLNSEFKVSINEKFSSGDLNFLGNALKLKFNRNHVQTGETELDIMTNKWNIAQTFSIFSESLRSGSYQTNLTGHLNIKIPNQNPANFSGEFTATELFLRNGSVEMAINKPIGLSAKNGTITAENFEIVGDNTYIRLKSTVQPAQELGLTLDGRLDLSLISLLTPFLDDLKGLLKFSFSLDGKYSNPKLSGSAFLENSLIKIKGFPHSLEQITADVIFNNETIVINAAKGKIGGGQFNGNGRIEARTIGEVPIDIKGNFYDAKFNVPEGFNTRGSGDFFVRGAWFPYTVGVNYSIDSGSIEKRTLDTAKNSSAVKPSSYLPKTVSSKQFTPVNLALDVNIRRALPVRLAISRVDINSEVLGNMKITGPPDSPLLTGRINIVRGGKITFRNNIFEIKNGFVEYSNSAATNPALSIQADARVTAQLKNNETRDYDVDMNVQGTAENPKITLTSQPALPENDLVSLLTLGFINSESTTSQSEDDINANARSQILSAIATEQIDRIFDINNKFGMKFDINSSYDSEDKAEKHKLTLRKQITPKFGASASREIGKTTTTNVKAEYKLNKNLSVIGEWEGKEPTGTEQGGGSTEKDLNTFGIDIEYKVDFR